MIISIALLAGLLIGLGVGYLVGSTRKIVKLTEQIRQESRHRELQTLRRNGRRTPKRPDADEGASRIHKVRMSRNAQHRSDKR